MKTKLDKEELLRENRDLRIKVKQMEQEILDQISHSGVWIEKLKAKSQQVIDLLNKYDPEDLKKYLAKTLMEYRETD